jgi:hypothetical protein
MRAGSEMAFIGRVMAGLFAVQLLCGCAPHSPTHGPIGRGAGKLEWLVSCRPGEDGFASNCVATAQAAPFVLRLSTADSQLSMSILHSRCEEVRNFDRVDLIGLSSERRARLVADAFADAAAAVHQRCPQLPRPAVRVDDAPDISVVGAVN